MENIDNKKIVDVLIGGNYITQDNLKQAEDFAKHNKSTVLDYLLTEGIINREAMGQAIAESLKVSYSNLSASQPSADQVLKIPEEIAKKYHAVVYKESEKEVVIASDQPTNIELKKSVEKLFKGKKILFTFSLGEDIDEVFVHYRKPLETRFSKIIKDEKRVAPEIIEEIFDDAYTLQASDIHFEPQEKEFVIIRFRIDGILHEAGEISKIYYESILNRIKVLAHLRIDEHLTPQDGAIRHQQKNGHSLDMRVSMVPTFGGEKIVIRLLSEYVRGYTLTDIGLNNENEAKITAASKKPFGMIVVCGPTGSGKTTTLYSLLKIVNHPEVNITTIEDPIEYRILGANQIQVNEQAKLTFSKGLRSIVRQDPDVILVGEIRDTETAELAVNAALTGHLLFSTFHANDAATAVPRLLDMGIEPFLLSSTMELLVAQRLVRKICESCRYSESVKVSDLEASTPGIKKYFTTTKTTLYKGKGCKVCNGTGYKGRSAVFEVIKVTTELRNVILKNPSTQEVWQIAKSQGAKSMFEDGLEKVEKGVTSLEEILRVTSIEA